MPPPAQSGSDSSSTQVAVEAARYALLRRLAPSMRHHLVVNLQPIGMIYEVIDRRLRSPEPDLASVHDSAQKINGFARAALTSCLDVVSWLAPEEGAVCSVTQGVAECASLLATNLAFRGYVLRSEVAGITQEVQRSAIRSVLTAAMICMTDEFPAPAELVLTAQQEPGAVKLVLTLKRTDGDEGYAGEAGYRPIEWSDVQALAGAEGVGLQRDGAHSATLSIASSRLTDR